MPASKRLAGALVGVLVGAGGATWLPPGQAAAATPAVPARATVPPAAAQAITLITGDVVELASAGDGRVAATVRPGSGREHVRFSTVETSEGVRVLPSDALPLLREGRLDAELFDVQHLIEQGYGDARSGTLPLIIQGEKSASAKVKGTPLPSLGAVAVKADKQGLTDFWRTQVAAGTGARTATTATHIWLDGKVKPVLDRSTAQIGAPQAWAAGLDGQGVKVAVLDTGADASHPDLAGKIDEARDFSGSADTGDHFGHGTHVAATVAGTGAGSNGTRKGVAPAARLLIGKVLDDSGSGYESGIIAGMEWAAGAGARVINMSLGGSATDGTDPMSAAVNELSESTGALFVVAAGNEGASYQVGTPGAAADALTVGAVDRDDRIADFSSRGPRVGDEGLKPEITAPGVGIVAARAAGTEMGTPVDELYTAASGTSMATPHVAGAAAIVAQQHPGWTGRQIKDELVSTARTTPDTPVFSQGAGRVDLARATTQKVAGTGVADFGLHQMGEKPVTRTVTYTNGGAAPITLTLSDTLAAITPSRSTVTVPAGGQADVVLTYDLKTPGQISGWLTATGPGGVLVTTALAGTLDRPHHTVTVKAVGRDGRPAAAPAMLMFGDDPRFDVLDAIFAGQTRTYEVAEGDYLLDATITDGHPLDEQDTLITNPELRVDRDLTITLDARTAKPVKIETPRPAEQQTVFSYYVHRVTGSGRGIINGFMNFSSVQAVNVTPTAKLRQGSYEFSSRWQLVAPLATSSIPGVDLNLTASSPVYSGTRRFDLVAGLTGNVRGKAVVLETDNYYDAALQAAEAGAAVALVVFPDTMSAWGSWQPDGERMPIINAVVPNDDGQRLLAQARKRGASISLTLTPDSPYLYDVFQVSKDRVPSQIVYRVTPANSQRITSRYQDNGGFDYVREQRFGWRPAQEYSWNDAQRAVKTPFVREEWISTGDTLWQHQVHHEYPFNSIGASLDGGFQDDPISYGKAGRSSETWAAPVVRPAGEGTREGNLLKLRVADFVDADGHYQVDLAGQAATLSRNGVVVGEYPNAWRDVAVPAGSFKLSITTKRGGEEWLYGTSTSTEWTFTSARDGKLPLLQPKYDVPVDLQGVARGTARITVPGAKQVKVEYSMDEGKTWRAKAGTGTVSLRVTASDRAGNTVRQTVIRAYAR
ncbi:S8 family peptidase [Paractinoplanes atraurantiacus]|uniref:Serine protease, subtilisin family n=1 Tax=Paractinoplanes atraurantiacus TaxID=1036182 RepID=A0A285H2K4_9ACTN|nr:S8 family serine peptidase [Actinoplanes atraurantiacus]SNY29987.1 Serine protease, subtilisin family [Actinoplanes atraurantiacus]